jgi:hypothetical protein
MDEWVYSWTIQSEVTKDTLNWWLWTSGFRTSSYLNLKSTSGATLLATYKNISTDVIHLYERNTLTGETQWIDTSVYETRTRTITQGKYIK